jgi:25S rRNA (uracil2843-N3)-methyltransferase
MPPPKRPAKTAKSKSSRPRATAEKHEPPTSSSSATTIPLELQQLILNLFRIAFPDTFSSELSAILQNVKTALFNRDFRAAFGTPENLNAYAVRWSPSRALAYTHLFQGILADIVQSGARDDVESVGIQEVLRMVCLGGGAGAELVAAGAVLRFFKDDADNNAPVVGKIAMTAVDVASWNDALQVLHHSIVTPPPVSKYAAAHVLETNKAMIAPTDLEYMFQQRDVLEIHAGQETQELFGNANLVTAFFTMNELFSASIAKTNTILLRLKNAMRPGSFLLVVDSAGSYATVKLNGGEKTYPMQWLLDHTMLSQEKRVKDDASIDGTTENACWTKVRSEDSTWFRIPEGLKYPLELENMRYQLHLYQKDAIP